MTYILIYEYIYLRNKNNNPIAAGASIRKKKMKMFSEFSIPISAHVEISDLIALGWEFEEEDYSGYHAVITVRENCKTSFEIVNSEKIRNGIWEGSDEEPTGNDEQTIRDLQVLHSEGKLWNIKHSVE